MRYLDENANGFIDAIEYTTLEWKGEQEINEKLVRRVSLLELADENEKKAIDMCELIDPRVDAKPCGWKVATWDGKPLTADDFEGTPNKEIYDTMMLLYANTAEAMWRSAMQLYKTAKDYGLNKSENARTAWQPPTTKEGLAQLKEIGTPVGYAQLLNAKGLRDKYHNGYWLRELVFADFLAHSGLDKRALQKLYYTGRMDELCDFIRANSPSTREGE